MNLRNVRGTSFQTVVDRLRALARREPTYRSHRDAEEARRQRVSGLISALLALGISALAILSAGLVFWLAASV